MGIGYTRTRELRFMTGMRIGISMGMIPLDSALECTFLFFGG